MIDRATAKRIASDYINNLSVLAGAEMVLLDDYTLEKDFRWVFFFNSKRYVETNDFHYALAGNGPLLVEKSNGTVHELTSALDVEESLQLWQEQKQ